MTIDWGNVVNLSLSLERNEYPDHDSSYGRFLFSIHLFSPIKELIQGKCVSI